MLQDNELTFETSEQGEAPTPPRRRTRGRRVVRGAGSSATTVVTVSGEAAAPAAEPAGEPAGEPNPASAPEASPMPGIAAAIAETPADRNASDEKQKTEPEKSAKAPRAARKPRRTRGKDADEAAREAKRARTAALAEEFFTDPGVSEDDEPAPVQDAEDRERTNPANPEGAESVVRRRTRRRASSSAVSAASGETPDAVVLDTDPQDRARRARSAVSQIVEFSASEPAAVSAGAGRMGGAAGKPMMSLLFQEPSAFEAHGSQDESGDANLPAGVRRRSRRSRRASTNGTTTPAAIVPEELVADASDGSRSHRRLNAEERRAAAEVEQIENDLVNDDIHYRPVEDEEGHAEDESSTRVRRRGRRGSRRDEADEPRDSARGSSQAADREDRASRDRDDEAEAPARVRRRSRRDEEDEETTSTRVRRRHRRGKADEEEVIPRSRKQQYFDEITDVEGSTRLEAKRQRRRDNRRDRSRQTLITEQDFLARRENVERLMVVREKDRHTQISVIEDNTLVEHYVSDIQDVSSVGNVYLGRVQNVLPSMEAAFVDIGQARNGVLYAGEVNWDTTRLEGQSRRIELAFKRGDTVLVQVKKDPIGHKGSRLTSQVTLAGRFLVLVPLGGMTGVSRRLSAPERTRLKNIVSKFVPKDMGVIIRTAAEGADQEAIEKDFNHLMTQWQSICAKRKEFEHSRRPHLLQGEPDVAIRVVRDIFNDNFSRLIVQGDGVYERIKQYLGSTAPDLLDRVEKWEPEEHGGRDVFDKWSIDSQLRKGMERKVYLPSGGSLVIDRTEAMTTIDVNTGRYTGKGESSLEETVTRCNLEAAEEIVRQLRLRDIGGMIMIDFVDMIMPANRDLVLRRLVECLSRDRTKHQVAEVTSLGLVQMTRQRVGQGLVEAFSEECPTCKGRGFILHDEPVVSASYDDPYALKGGDPFVHTNKHNRGTQAPERDARSSSSEVKAKMAQIAAAAQAQAASEDASRDARE